MQKITAKELSSNKDSFLIIDIRENDVFKDWHIKGSQNIDVYNNIWDENFDEAKQKLSALPKDKKIVTVCNAGVTSQKASALLESLGYKTSILENGMVGWNSLHIPSNVINEDDLLITQITRIGKGCLSYLIGSNSLKECIIVDPSHFINEYIDISKNMGFIIKGVIETHVHADHVSGAKLLAEKTNSHFITLKGKDAIKIGNVVIKALPTPGHTDESVCLIINNKAILTGDTLFLDGVGRPDLGRDEMEIKKGAELLYASLNKLKELNKDLIVLPAHFSNYENFPIFKKYDTLLDKNNALKIKSESEFIDYILNNLPAMPPNYEQIKEINKNNSKIAAQIAEQLEFGPNRCASG